MKAWIFTYLFVSSFTPIAKLANETVVDSKIEEVTVFKNSAQIVRRTSSIPIQTSSIIKIEGISPFVDQKSIEVKINGNGILNGIQFRRNHFKKNEMQSEMQSYQDNIDRLDDSLEVIQIKLEALTLREDFLKSNKLIKGEAVNLELASLSELDGYYTDNLTDILLNRRKLAKDELRLSIDKKRFVNQLAELQPKKASIPYDLLVNIRSGSNQVTQQNISLQIRYQVGNAGWYSSYDLRADAIDEPIKLKHKANVFQSTGEEWNNVILSFSNENTGVSKEIPVLTPQYLPARNSGTSQIRSHHIPSVSGYVFDHLGFPIIGANISICGLSLGTVSDFDGFYSLNLPMGFNQLEITYLGYKTTRLMVNQPMLNTVLQESEIHLDEVVVKSLPTKNISQLAGKTSGISMRGSRSDATYYYIDGVRVSAQTVENTINYEDNLPIVSMEETELNFKFTLDEKYSIQSDGKNNEIALRMLDLEASFSYKAIPKLNSNVYLTAYIDEWEDKNLLPGNMNLYFEGGYIGNALLDPNQLKDSIQLSLGVDSKIKIERKRKHLFTKKLTMKNKKLSSLGYEIGIKNLKNKAIKLEVWDQIPVSTIKEIEVEQDVISAGFDLEPKTGIGKWEIKLDAEASKTLDLSFEIKYPRQFNFRF